MDSRLSFDLTDTTSSKCHTKEDLPVGSLSCLLLGVPFRRPPSYLPLRSSLASLIESFLGSAKPSSVPSPSAKGTLLLIHTGDKSLETITDGLLSSITSTILVKLCDDGFHVN